MRSRDEAADGVVGVDPRVHARGRVQLGARRAQLDRHDGSSARECAHQRPLGVGWHRGSIATRGGIMLLPMATALATLMSLPVGAARAARHAHRRAHAPAARRSGPRRPRSSSSATTCCRSAWAATRSGRCRRSLAEALAAGADTLITCGGVQSNHARVTAAAGAALGLHVVLVVNGADAGRRRPATRGSTACSAPRCGTSRRATSARRRWKQVAAELRAAGRRPFVVPLGASTADRRARIRAGVAEVAAAGLKPDVIVHSTSSGGTQAGLIAGCALFGLTAARHRRERGRSGRVARRASSADLLDQMAARLGARPRDARRRPPDRGRRRVRRRRLRRADAGVDRGARAGGAPRRHPARSGLHREGDGRPHRTHARRCVPRRTRPFCSGTPAGSRAISRNHRR